MINTLPKKQKKGNNAHKKNNQIVQVSYASTLGWYLSCLISRVAHTHKEQAAGS